MFKFNLISNTQCKESKLSIHAVHNSRYMQSISMFRLSNG